jgi:hypothetical protein
VWPHVKKWTFRSSQARKTPMDAHSRHLMEQIYPINYMCCVRTEPSMVAAFPGTQYIHKIPHVLDVDVSRKSGLSSCPTLSLSLSGRNSLHAPGSLVVCVCVRQGLAVMSFGLHEGPFCNPNNKPVGGQDRSRGTYTPFQAKISRENFKYLQT